MIASASSLAIFSLSAFGALSTNSLASFRPKPVTSRTTLITLILEAPALVKITSNSDCSSAASAAAAPPTIATGAAAVTPNSSSIAFTKSFKSRTDISLIASIICSLVILYKPPKFISYYFLNFLK